LRSIIKIKSITVRGAGITISTNSDSRKTPFRIRGNLGEDSNVTKESDRHPEKDPSPRTVIDTGILTKFNPVPKKAQQIENVDNYKYFSEREIRLVN
jgi:hypothetical protein